MVIKEWSRRLLPPIAIDAGKWLRRSGAQQPVRLGTRVRFSYGRFFLTCDSSHQLPKVLQHFPNFGRNLADVVIALALELVKTSIVRAKSSPPVAGTVISRCTARPLRSCDARTRVAPASSI